jgi:hypothetical protein
MANTDLLLDTLNRVTPLSWPEFRQNNWCACFGAHAIQEYGYEVSKENGGDNTKVFDATGAEVGTTRKLATEILGLTEIEGQVLFSASNTKPLLKAIVAALISGKITQEQWLSVAMFDTSVEEVLGLAEDEPVDIEALTERLEEQLVNA